MRNNLNYYYSTDLSDLLDYEEVEKMNEWEQYQEVECMRYSLVAALDNYARKYKTAGLVVVGSSTRWNGKTTGFNVVDLRNDDIDKIFTFERGCDDISIYSDDENPGALFASGVHHDGGVDGEIMTITRKGLDYVHLHCDVLCDKWSYEVLEHLKKTGQIKPFFSGNRKLA